MVAGAGSATTGVSFSPANRRRAILRLCLIIGSGSRSNRLQLVTHVVHLQRADRVDRARSQPRVVAAEQRLHGLFRGIERSAHEAIGEVDALGGRDLGIEQRHEQLPKLRRQDVVEQLERVRSHEFVGRSEADVGVVQAHVRQQQRHQAEDSIELLLHRALHRLDHGIVLLQP